MVVTITSARWHNYSLITYTEIACCVNIRCSQQFENPKATVTVAPTSDDSADGRSRSNSPDHFK